MGAGEEDAGRLTGSNEEEGRGRGGRGKGVGGVGGAE